jgi:hypothetical protein
MYSIDGFIATTSLAMCLAVFCYVSSKAFERYRIFLRAAWGFLFLAAVFSTLKTAGYRWHIETNYSDVLLIYAPLAVLLCSAVVGAYYFIKATR